VRIFSVQAVEAPRGGDVGWPCGRGYALPYGPTNETTTGSLMTPGTKTGKGSNATSFTWMKLDGNNYKNFGTITVRE